jgi:YidC/Oxa1 family membrane protein insertase
MLDTQRLIALIVFSFSALLLWDAWQKHNAPKVVPGPQTTVPAAPSAPGTTPQVPNAATPSTPGAPPSVPTAQAPTTLAGEPVVVKTDLFDVELNTLGGDIRRVTMKQQHSALDRAQPLTLMEPDPKHYFVTQTGLLGEGLPTHKAAYETSQQSYALAPGSDALEVRLKAREVNGAEVTKVYSFKRGSYVIDVAYEIANKGDKPIAPYAYFQFLRDGNPPTEQAAQTSAFAGVTTFTGPAIYTEEAKFHKVDFSDIAKSKQSHVKKAKDGWIGIIQHYFVSAWLPKDGTEREYFTNKVGDNLYTAGVVTPVGQIAPGATAKVDVPVYIGPQETSVLEQVAPGLKYVVDYGWLYVLAAPLFWFLKWIHSIVGNWGWSIIVLTICIKLVFYPLNAKAGRSMAQMKVLTPKMEKLKEMYGEDRQKLNQAMMELYRTEKINPLGGCLPILVQIPVFIALYWVLLASIELRHAPWLGWIQDLSAPDPYFILPVIYAVSMLVQTKLNPQPADPVQAKVMLFMPIMFSVFFLFFPAGLVLYWVVQNLLSILQQWHINRTLAREAKAKARR